ncbi:hypothetical protein [Streptomyces sp. NPDC002402]
MSYLITASVIGVIGGLMAVWPSIRPRVRAVPAEPTTCANTRAQQEYRKKEEL